MYKTTVTTSDAEIVPGSGVRYLVTEKRCGSISGAVGIGVLPPQERVPLHRHANAEEASVVLAGSGTLLTAVSEVHLGPGQLIFAPRGAWHGIRASGEGLQVLLVLGGLGDPAQLETEFLGDRNAEAALDVVTRNLQDSEEVVVHEPGRGFFYFKARFGLDGTTAATTNCMLMQSSSEPGLGRHDLHRHPSGDEFAFFVEGSDLVHLMTRGRETATSPGDLTFTPAGEWHGAENRGTRGLALFGFLGANSLDQAGYELYDGEAA